jgi:hypothetical protein
MPLQDSRTPSFPHRDSGLKKKLGKRDVAPVDTELLLNELKDALVGTAAQVLEAGGAVLFGSTRDRGAVLIRAWVAGDQYEDYVTSVAELVATLEALSDVAEAAMKRDPRPRP